MTSTTGKPAARSGEIGGFTLVELVLVMTLLTVVMALAAPSLATFFRGRSLDAEARRLLALARYGQNRAASEGMAMTLWLDIERRAYGLEAEAGAAELDAKAVEYELDRELQLETDAPTVTAPMRAQAQSALSLTLSGKAHRGLPGMRFLPDGTIDPTSAPAVRVIDRQGAALWLRLARNGLTYEIGQPTNWWNPARP